MFLIKLMLRISYILSTFGIVMASVAAYSLLTGEGLEYLDTYGRVKALFTSSVGFVSAEVAIHYALKALAPNPINK